MDAQGRAASVVEEVLSALDVEWQRSSERVFAVVLPGTHKLQTACALEVGAHTLSARAFVCRRPDEDHDRVHRWLLQRNLRAGLVAFSIDRLGDIHLTGAIPLSGVTVEVVDALLGEVARSADDSFDTLLQLGFASSIRAEWSWRRARGLPVDNLAAFAALAPPEAAPEVAPD